jgi:hypothetical protein
MAVLSTDILDFSEIGPQCPLLWPHALRAQRESGIGPGQFKPIIRYGLQYLAIQCVAGRVVMSRVSSAGFVLNQW